MMFTADFGLALLNHLWQSTLFAGAAAALTVALRKNHARTRYWIWLAASLKFLIPFSLLAGLGAQVEWRTAPSVSQPVISYVVSQAYAPAGAAPIATTAEGSGYGLALAALWVVGFIGVIFSWWRGWRRIQLAANAARPVGMAGGVPVMSADAGVEPGVFGILRPVLLLPAGIQKQLEPAHINAILAHELCHVRYRDNLAAALHMAVEALFWFHPLVWWLGARLLEERERACDEEVLRLGNQPEIYAESILKTCAFYLESPLTCVSGVTGSDLTNRIARIMTGRVSMRLQAGKKLLLTAMAVLAVMVPLIAGLMQAAPRQSTTTTPAKLPAFDVISIKPDGSGEMRVRLNIQPGTFRAEGVSMKLLMQEAYGVKDAQIIGAPAWFNMDKYNIEARSDEETAEAMKKMDPELRKDTTMIMLRSLLTERCKMAVHQETKEMSILSMLVAKSGSKLKESAPPEKPVEGPDGQPAPPAGRGQGMRMQRGELIGTTVPMRFLADVLSRQLGRTVVDNTGLKGSYDFDLKWTPDENEGQMFKVPGGGDGAAPPPASQPAGPTIFTAIQEQLGLKLDATKGPIAVWMIDHVEKPSAN